MADEVNLTPAGWPRPVFGGWPIPWVSPKTDLAQMEPDRIEQIVSYRLCQVCGEGHQDDDVVYLIANAQNENTSLEADMSNLVVMSMDHSILHKHCAKLAIAMCPQLKKLKAEGALLVISAHARDIEVFAKDDGTDGVGVEGGKATVIGDSV